MYSLDKVYAVSTNNMINILYPLVITLENLEGYV